MPTSPLFDDAELALIIRGGFRESVHRGLAVAVAGDGSIAAALGDPDTPILPRSSLKPFQAIASLRAGAELAGEGLAIAAGSHHGTDAHLAAVRATLAAAGLDEDALGCPPALPADPDALRAATLAAGNPSTPGNAPATLGNAPATPGNPATGNPATEHPTPIPDPRRIWHNCSGKHSGMLAACVAAGWDTATYLDPKHPYQELVRETITELVGPIHATTTDGCGAPIHALTLREFATAFARLPWADPHGVRVCEAMRTHPVMVGGPTSLDTRLMQLIPGILAKGGAEGVLAISAPGGGAVVVKASDGSQRPTMLAALHLLGLLGVDTSAANALGHTAVLGGGLPVGSLEPSLELLTATQGE